MDQPANPNDVLRHVYVQLMNIATMIDDYVNPNPQPKSQVNSQVNPQDNLQAESSLGFDAEMSSNSGNRGGGKKKARKPSAKAAPKPAAKATPKKKK